MQQLLRTQNATPSPLEWTGRFLFNLAIQDWLLLGYLFLFLLALIFGTGPERQANLMQIEIDLATLGTALLLVRGGILKDGLLTSLFYRLTIFFVLFLSYFQLRGILLAVSPAALDSSIFAFDLRLFGFEPSLAWDRYINRFTTEWFSFFYFSHFFLLVVHVIPFLLMVQDRWLLARFSLGICTVFCVGHLLYMVVPGYGPYRYLEDRFTLDLNQHGGFFWTLVRETVEAGGAQKDIFPSLHTAVPTFFALFSFYHRDRNPFAFTWPIVTFFASQIVIATMFLRWHYLIDIIAGLTLASIAMTLATRLADWERKRRAELGVQEVFSPLLRK